MKRASTSIILSGLVVLTIASGCDAAKQEGGDALSSPGTKTETVEIMNDNVRLLLDGVMKYQTAPMPPESAALGTIRSTGCRQVDGARRDGPPWKYAFSTGDAYTPEKVRLLEQRITELTEAGWRVIRSPESDPWGRWTIAQGQNFLLTVELPSEKDRADRPPEQLHIVVTSMSPCVDVDDNS